MLLALSRLPYANGFEPSGNTWEFGRAELYVGMTGNSPTGGSWRDALLRAMAAWSDGSAFEFVAIDAAIDPCLERNTSAFGDGRSAIDFTPHQCGTEYGENVLAVTLNTLICTDPACVNPAHITESDIVFNSSLDWDIYSGPLRFPEQDFERVALHELGHVLGLGHESTSFAIMQPSVSNLDRLQSDDFDGANFIYGGSVSFQSIYGFEVTLPAASVFSDPISAAQLSGELAPSDAQVGGRFIDVFQFTFTNNTRIDLRLNSGEINPKLYLVRMAATQSVIAGSEFEDDDSGIGPNSRITADIPAGTYWLGASSSNVAELGEYSIEMNANALASQLQLESFESIYGAMVQINPNPHIAGELGFSDFSFDNRFLDLYQFQVDASTNLQIDLTSNDFDASLMLVEIRENQLPGALVLQDDDGGVGFNSRINQLLNPGTYWIGVTSFGASESGDYDIEVSVLVP